MGASAPKQVSDLVQRFSRDRKVFLSPGYKEEQLRAASLAGRRSTFGVRSFRKQVIHEESIKACPELGRRVAGATKAPDYTFRTVGWRCLDLPAARSYIDAGTR
jgi:hypothetical protein